MASNMTAEENRAAIKVKLTTYNRKILCNELVQMAHQLIGGLEVGGLKVTIPLDVRRSDVYLARQGFLPESDGTYQIVRDVKKIKTIASYLPRSDDQ